VNSLIEQTAGRYRLVILSTVAEGVEEYRATHGMKASIFAVATTTKVAWKLGGTPQTFLVSTEGVLLRSWSGAYAGEQKKDLETYLQVRLPGLSPPATRRGD
jgi:hypothetical protein